MQEERRVGRLERVRIEHQRVDRIVRRVRAPEIDADGSVEDPERAGVLCVRKMATKSLSASSTTSVPSG
jgi:hypothetical protein